MDVTPPPFSALSARGSQSSSKQNSTPPSFKYKFQNQTPTHYNTPSYKYETILSQNNQLAEQLATKSIECNSLKLFIQNIQQSRNQSVTKLTDQNKSLLKQLISKQQQHQEFITKHIASIQKLECEFRDYRYEKQRQIKLLKQSMSKREVISPLTQSPRFSSNSNPSSDSRANQSSQENPKSRSKNLQTQINKLVNIFTIINTDPQKLKYLKSQFNNSNLPQPQQLIKQNFTLEQISQDQISLNIIKLKQQISYKDTDIRLLKEEIHNLTSTFSEQISKISAQLSKQKLEKQVLELQISKIRQDHQKQIKRVEQECKQCINSWSHAINEKQFSGIKGDLSQIQLQNIHLSKQLQDKINKLLEGDMQSCDLSLSRDRMQKQYQKFLQKENQIRELKLQIKSKEQNIRQILEKYRKLQSELQRMEENNHRIMEISRRRITTEEVREQIQEQQNTIIIRVQQELLY